VVTARRTDLIVVIGSGPFRIDQAKEGHFSPAIEIDIPGASISAPIIADFSADRCGGGFAVSGITVFDPKFRTSDGLGVGSTLGQLRQVRSVRVSHEEGVSAIVQGVRMAFAPDPPLDMNNARLPSIWLWLEAGTVRAQRCPNG
jgi:hypothetical protein